MSRLFCSDSGETVTFRECEECNGLGQVATWIGHGGEERDGPPMRCEVCGGYGEIENEI